MAGEIRHVDSVETLLGRQGPPWKWSSKHQEESAWDMSCADQPKKPRTYPNSTSSSALFPLQILQLEMVPLLIWSLLSKAVVEFFLSCEGRTFENTGLAAPSGKALLLP